MVGRFKIRLLRTQVDEFSQTAPKQTPACKQNNAGNYQGCDVVDRVPSGFGGIRSRVLRFAARVGLRIPP